VTLQTPQKRTRSGERGRHRKGSKREIKKKGREESKGRKEGEDTERI
jgi:hypothetical protein